MKTIIVVYTDKLISLSEANKLKHYAFITDDSLQVNDLIKSDAYTTAMQVIKVVEEGFTYFNMSTGELSNKYTSTAQREIRTLKIRTNESEVVYAVKLT